MPFRVLKEDGKSMTVIGVGPLWFALSVAAIVAVHCVLRAFPLDPALVARLSPWMNAAGAILVAYGAYWYVGGALVSRLAKRVQQSELVTDGVFAYTRNPIYAGVTFMLAGALCFTHDPRNLLAIVGVYLLLRLLVVREERALVKLFGDEYVAYRNRTNAVLPWFPRTRA